MLEVGAEVLGGELDRQVVLERPDRVVDAQIADEGVHRAVGGGDPVDERALAGGTGCRTLCPRDPREARRGQHDSGDQDSRAPDPGALSPSVEAHRPPPPVVDCPRYLSTNGRGSWVPLRARWRPPASPNTAVGAPSSRVYSTVGLRSSRQRAGR